MEQRILIRQKTVVSPKYFFHGLNHSMLPTTVQGFQLNLPLQPTGEYIKRRLLFHGVFRALQYNMEYLQPTLKG